MVMINKAVNVMSALFMICELYFRIKWKTKYTALSEQFQSLTIKKNHRNKYKIEVVISVRSVLCCSFLL